MALRTIPGDLGGSLRPEVSAALMPVLSPPPPTSSAEIRHFAPMGFSLGTIRNHRALGMRLLVNLQESFWLPGAGDSQQLYVTAHSKFLICVFLSGFVF